MIPTYAIHAACGLPFAEHDNRSPDTVSPFGCPKEDNVTHYEIADDEPVGTAHNRMVEESEQAVGRIRNDGGWDRRYRMPPRPARLEWKPERKLDPWMFECGHCGLKQREHIRNVYCPEWRLRQMDGDR